MQKYMFTGLMLCGMTMLVAGCTSYYRVTDPGSGKAYYTTKVGDAGRGGAVKIKDDKTGSTVTLQSSDVKEISEDEYKAGLVAQAPAKPASALPMAAPQPAPAPAKPATPQPTAAPTAEPSPAPADK